MINKKRRTLYKSHIIFTKQLSGNDTQLGVSLCILSKKNHRLEKNNSIQISSYTAYNQHEQTCQYQNHSASSCPRLKNVYNSLFLSLLPQNRLKNHLQTLNLKRCTFQQTKSSKPFRCTTYEFPKNARKLLKDISLIN